MGIIRRPARGLPAGEVGQPAAAASGPRPFAALGSRNYRLFWIGQFCSSVAHFTEEVARGWLVYEMTGSAFLLGAVVGVRALPLLVFGVLGGALADRFDRRRLLVGSQAAAGANALVLALLVATGSVEVWHVFATGLVAGTLRSFQLPTRHSLLPHLVEPRHLMNAVALDSLARGMARVGGPTVAGVLIALIGVKGAYFAQTGLLVVAALSSALMAHPEGQAAAAGPIWRSLRSGFAFIGKDALIRTLLLVALIPMLVGMPYVSLLPLFAGGILQIGPTGLGLLLSAAGVGSVLAGVGVAALGDTAGRGRLLFAGLALFGTALAVLGVSRSVPLSLVMMLLLGASQTTYMVTNGVLLQTATPDEFRGRVFSVYTLDHGLTPLGTLMAGSLAQLAGGPIAFVTMGVTILMLVGVVNGTAPGLRRV